MTTPSKMQQGLRRTRLVMSLFAIVACTAGLATAQDPPPDPPKLRCEYANLPGVGPCDPDRGYEWPKNSGKCYYDDGCYRRLERCCPLPGEE